jgi:hypothetical protein
MGCRGVFFIVQKFAVTHAIVACLHKPFMHVSSNVKGKHAVNSIHYNFFSFLAHLLLIIQAGMPRTHYLGGKNENKNKGNDFGRGIYDNRSPSRDRIGGQERRSSRADPKE